DQSDGLKVKLWRGERMCLIGMEVDEPEDDFVGFAIEVKSPGSADFTPLRNRLAFSYDKPASEAVTGYRNFPSLDAPFQKFRWVHFPYEPTGGEYRYRITKRHMPSDDVLKSGATVTLPITLDSVVYDGFLDVGFARNFASSQAYEDKYKGNPDVIPVNADDGLKFKKLPGDVYQWLGFEAYELIMGLLKACANDHSMSLDVFAYDLNEPDILHYLEQMGGRVRAIIDNSGTHGASKSAETQAAKRLQQSAGAKNVKRMHFTHLQHNKVLIAKKNGQPVKVLFGSTNFSFRGLYIQANNALVIYAPEAAALFERVFDIAFTNPDGFNQDPISKQWHLINVPGKPAVHLCFSPHKDTGLSLGPLGGAIDQATSSVFFSIAFLNQTKSGPTREAIDRLMKKNVFSYGISDKAGGLIVNKPDHSQGIVDFNYLAKHAPMPFKAEWSGGKGIHEHHKFVVTDFSLPTAKVFTGSSNLSPSGEKGNGDNLVMIEDQRVATSYAIEALRVFDHLHFRSAMSKAFGNGSTKAARGKAAAKAGARGGKVQSQDEMKLSKPTAISGKPSWFAGYYQKDTQKERDRLLFSR
ncbi:MAG TPA: phospholipase D-like domain-containing protein, partial [Bradyrhizobium sp.]|uniref:phospholipase D-like domain-containing protein n=1 Tax=Bradyrhizobium sp. TaxID=376 RepID=UPI002B488E4A